MGRDIHAFVEYRPPSSPDTPPELRRAWESLTRDAFELERDYLLFQALAGQGKGAFAAPDRPEPLIEPRGIPELDSPDACSEHVGLQQWALASDDADRHRFCEPARLSIAEAEKYVAEGRSRWGNEWGEGARWFTDPGYHSASWLTLSEVDAALEHQELQVATLAPCTKACLAAMRSLAEEHGPDDVRLVFWFDN